MNEELKKLNEQLGLNVKALQDEHARLTVEGKSSSDKMVKIVEDMAKLEAKNLELQAKFVAIEGAKSDAEGKLTELEKKLVELSKPQGNVANKNYKNSPEYKAMNEYIRFGNATFSMHPEMKSSMRTDINAAGGYLVPEMMFNEIQRQLTEISDVRKFARVLSIKTKSLELPVRTGLPTVTSEGEAEELPAKTRSSYRLERITGYRQTTEVGISDDQVAFSGFDMESEISKDVVEAFMQYEGEKYLKGTGVNQPEGVLINPTTLAAAVNTTDLYSGVTGANLLNDMINLPGNLKTGYLPTSRYFMGLDTLLKLRTAVSTSGGYLWTVGGESMPSTLNQFQYTVLPDMGKLADGASSKVAMFGDIRKAYLILDAIGMTVIRDEITAAASGLMYLTFKRWNTGKVILPEAVVLLKLRAS